MSAAPPTFTIGASPVRPTRFHPVDSADPRNIFARPTYAGPELRPTSVRPACDVGLDMPSRVGSTLRYRNGRITDLAGNPITDGSMSTPTPIAPKRPKPSCPSGRQEHQFEPVWIGRDVAHMKCRWCDKKVPA